MKEQTYKLVWEDEENKETGLVFDVKEVSSQRKSDLLVNCVKGSTSKDKNYLRKKLRKSGDSESVMDKFLNQVDYQKYNQLILQESIIGWEGLTNWLLTDIMEPEHIEFKGQKKKDEAIPFSEEMKKELCSHPSSVFTEVFFAFINTYLPEIKKELKRAELKN